MGRKSLRILAWLSALVFVVCALAYGLRDTVATHAAKFMLARSDRLHCTQPSIHIAAGLSRVFVDDIECTMASGPIRYVHTEGQTTIHLSGLKDVAVHVPKVTIDQRERDVSHVRTNTMGDLGELAGFSQTLYKGMLDSAELYSPSVPLVEADTLIMKRAGKVESVLHGFKQSLDGEWNRSQAVSVETGTGLVSVQALDLRVTPARGRMTASVYVPKPKGATGEKPDMKVRVTAVGLGEKHPRITLEI